MLPLTFYDRQINIGFSLWEQSAFTRAYFMVHLH